MKSAAAVLFLAMLGLPAMAHGPATRLRTADVEFASGLDALAREIAPVDRQVVLQAMLGDWPPDTPQALVIRTDLARARAERGDLDDAARLLDHVERQLPGMPAQVRVRHALVQGRVDLGLGQPTRAAARFAVALDLATCDGDAASAIDAARGLALAAPPDARATWYRRTLDPAAGAEDDRARRWQPVLGREIAALAPESGAPGTRSHRPERTQQAAAAGTAR